VNRLTFYSLLVSVAIPVLLLGYHPNFNVAP
jgi:hypothetical protein